jgi:hypothetical protein
MGQTLYTDSRILPITLRSGTLVDATITDAPSATKNKSGARDPEMSPTKKGNDWYLGPLLVVCKQITAGQRKAHIGVDAESGVTHSLETSTAKLPPLVECDAFDCRATDSQVWDALLHGDETSVWADKGYINAAHEAAFSGPGNPWGVMRKAPKGG